MKAKKSKGAGAVPPVTGPLVTIQLKNGVMERYEVEGWAFGEPPGFLQLTLAKKEQVLYIPQDALVAVWVPKLSAGTAGVDVNGYYRELGVES